MTDEEFERLIQQLDNEAWGDRYDFAKNVQLLYDAVRGVDAESRRVLTAYVLRWPDAEREQFARAIASARRMDKARR